MAAKQTITKEQLRATFNELDTDKKGKLDSKQFEGFADKYPEQIKQRDVSKIFKHMNLHKDQNGITFDEFYVWWENREKNLLPLLYFRQQVQKKLNQARDEIELQKQKQSADKKHTNSKFEVSINNGASKKETELSLQVCTHVQAEKESQKYRNLLHLGSNPAVLFRIQIAEGADIDEAHTNLADLVEQGKMILESVLPPELSEQYLKLVDIKVEKDEKSLILSISSNNDLVSSIYASYEELVKQLHVQDQSINVEVTYSSSLDLGSENISEKSILAELLKGLNIDFKLDVSPLVLDNLRQILYSKINTEIEQNNGELNYRKTNDYFLLVFSSLLSGVSVKLNADKFEDKLPAKVNSLTFEQLLSKAKSQTNQLEEAMSLPIFQDVINFFDQFTVSNFEVLAIGPGFYSKVHFKTNKLSNVLLKILQS